MEFIVVMTSWWNRITNLPIMIRRILANTVVPSEIAIYLSSDELKDYEYPEEVVTKVFKNPKVKIHWVKENLKSFKRLLALKDYPNHIVITIDDDRMIPNTYFEKILEFITPNYYYANSIDLSRAIDDRLEVYTYDPGIPAPVFICGGFIGYTSLLQSLDIDPYLCLKYNWNDDDFYLSMTMMTNDLLGLHIPNQNFRVDDFPDCMKKGHNYTRKSILNYFKEVKPINYKKYQDLMDQYCIGPYLKEKVL